MANIFQKLSNKVYSHLKLFSDAEGVFYPPIYNMRDPFTINKPKIYNQDGQPMDMFFLRDINSAHEPYFFSSKYFLMDRFNYALDTHFYAHNAMLQQMGKPKRKYGILFETPAIVPKDYLIFQKHKGLEKDFDLIFTYSSKILDGIQNARFVPFQAAPWYGTAKWGGVINPERYKMKNKNISILSSAKIMCDMHKIRFDLANRCKNNHLADAFGTFDGGKPADLVDVLDDYRYTILLENEIDDYYFSERLTNCFLSMTVPIYCGAKKIGNFFNADGIIQLPLDKIDSIESILSACSEKDYETRVPAIIDNFNRVQKFRHVLDWMYEEYLR